jgi:hypothetical protein
MSVKAGQAQIGIFQFTDPRNDVRESVLLYAVQQLRPPGRRVGLHQAGDAVGEQRCAIDLVVWPRSGDRLIGGRRFGAGDPVASGLVAMAPLCHDEFLHAFLVRWRPDGVLMSGQVLLLCKRVDPAVGDDHQTGWSIQDDHGVEQQQILHTLVLLP